MRPEEFPSFRFPAVACGAILCVGLHLDADDGWLEAVAPFVVAEERRRAARFARKIDAIRHLAGRALVRRVLHGSRRGSLPGSFVVAPRGKPSAPNEGVDFSISHSGGMVWAAFCRDATVGIDVEEIRDLPDIAELASQLHPDEAAAIRALPDATRNAAFYRCWTRKEAFLKATGEGLSRPLDSFRVDIGTDESGWISGGSAAEALWTSADIGCGTRHQCCVAASAPRLEPVIVIA
ncbi:4'-phosphopantetheinyl transferase superfamily protein [uncultured Alphaproteobacteria bacterium]|uniref:4'-phosphopantetheinyl transferase superfamily protein n=1 Tax=uncultured Alphaproteobacteria bacterium TaxID=91750 RepID=A0A212J557_9PROT|nr:4'-phosphopantetheinyl transferase superfamily protein [uncultured Alphaproteobacteria bacterium]